MDLVPLRKQGGRDPSQGLMALLLSKDQIGLERRTIPAGTSGRIKGVQKLIWHKRRPGSESVLGSARGEEGRVVF